MRSIESISSCKQQVNFSTPKNIKGRYELYDHILKIKEFDDAYGLLVEYADTIENINAGIINIILHKTRDYQDCKKLILFAVDHDISVDDGNLHYIIEKCCNNYLEIKEILVIFEEDANILPKKESCNIAIKTCKDVKDVIDFLENYQALYTHKLDSYSVSALMSKCANLESFLEIVECCWQKKIIFLPESIDSINFKKMLQLPYKNLCTVNKLLQHKIIAPELHNCEIKSVNNIVRDYTDEYVSDFKECLTLLNIFKDIKFDATTLTCVAHIALKAKKDLKEFLNIFADRGIVIDGPALSILYKFKQESNYETNIGFTNKLMKHFIFDNKAKNVAISVLSKLTQGNLQLISQILQIFVVDNKTLSFDTLTISLILDNSHNLDELLELLNLLEKIQKEELLFDKAAFSIMFNRCKTLEHFELIYKNYARDYYIFIENLINDTANALIPKTIDMKAFGVFLQAYFIFSSESQKRRLIEVLGLKNESNYRTDVGKFVEYNFHSLETLFITLPKLESIKFNKEENLRLISDRLTISTSFAIAMVSWLLNNTKHSQIGIVTGFNSGNTLNTNVSAFLEEHQYSFGESKYAKGTIIISGLQVIEPSLFEQKIETSLIDESSNKINPVAKKRKRKKTTQSILPETVVEHQEPVIVVETTNETSSISTIFRQLISWRPW